METVFKIPPPSWPRRLVYASFAIGLFAAGIYLLSLAQYPLVDLSSESFTLSSVGGALLILASASFLLLLAYSCTLGALPFGFVADATSRECGYRWNSWWTRKKDLTNAVGLRGDVMYVVISSRGTWRWWISAVQADEDWTIHLYNPLSEYLSEEEATAECQQILSNLAAHLSLPMELIVSKD